MHVTAIVLAAGQGLRFGSLVSKSLVEIKAKPAIIYCLITLSRHPDIGEIILVVNAQNLKRTIREIKQYRIAKIKNIVLGGRRRQDSVTNGLKVICPRTDLVLIHDGVRPFLEKKVISASIRAAKRYGAAIVGVPVKATVKSVAPLSRLPVARCSGVVKKTLNRSELWEVQTPQVFRKDLILKAYSKFGHKEVTDDAALVEKLGHRVHLVMGSYSNIKITTPEDLVIAEAILKAKK